MNFNSLQGQATSHLPPTFCPDLQDLLCVEARVVRPTQFANYLTIHRKGVPGVEDGEPLAYELRCFPDRDQVCLVTLVPQLMTP